MRLKSRVLQLFFSAFLWVFGGSAFSQAQTADGAKLRDISPDKKFAVRIRYDAEKNRKLLERLPAEEKKADAEQISSEAIVAVELVKLPEKEVVENLLGTAASFTRYDDIMLIWSSDSKWFAFYAPTETRVGYTRVYHDRGGTFMTVGDPEDLRIDAHGSNEWVKPLRWIKPGVLMLKQSDSGRNDTKVAFQFTVRFEAKDNFQVINKKKIRVDAE